MDASGKETVFYRCGVEFHFRPTEMSSYTHGSHYIILKMKENVLVPFVERIRWCVVCTVKHKEFICHNQLLLQLLHHHLQQRSLPLCLSLDSCLIIQNHMLGQTQQTRPALFSLRFWCRSCDTFGILWPLTSVHNEVWATNCIELHL